MNTKLEKQIYSAQSLGNIEPIEHMVPYPNLRALVEGQNIKYEDKLVYADLGLTSYAVYRLAQQTANWLAKSGVNPKDRVMMEGLEFPEAEILAFGIWTLGASLVLVGDKDFTGAEKSCSPKLNISKDLNFLEKIKTQSEVFEPSFKPLLNHEAMVFWTKGKGIRLSHYNLLVNTNGIQHAIDLYDNDSFFVRLEPDTTAWVILQAMLPLYAGVPLTSNNPDLTIGKNGQFKHNDFIIDFDWTALMDSTPPHLYYAPENTAFLSLNSAPLHLTAIQGNALPLKLEGHSVMMGYLEEEENKNVFRDGCLSLGK